MSKVQNKIDQQISKIEFLFNFIRDVDTHTEVDDSAAEQRYIEQCDTGVDICLAWDDNNDI